MSFLKLDEYLIGAQRIILDQNCGFLMNDEDAIADVAYKMMVADQTWDGRSSRDTWRYSQAKYAIMRIIAKRKKKKLLLSLDYGTSSLVERIPIKSHEEIFDKFVEICDKAKELLDTKQYECIVKHHRDHMTMEAIGLEMGISKQRVQQHIKKGIEKLQTCLSKLDL